MKKQPKTIRTSANFTLLYYGKKNGIKVYTVRENAFPSRESKLFEQEVATSIRYLKEEDFEEECLGLLVCEDFHLEQIGQE